MAERVTASVRAVLTRTLWLRCPHCRAESELELPPLAHLLPAAQGTAAGLGLPISGGHEREVFDVLHAASPQWVDRTTLYEAVWGSVGSRSVVSIVIGNLARKLVGTDWRLQRRYGLYRVVPADGHG